MEFSQTAKEYWGVIERIGGTGGGVYGIMQIWVGLLGYDVKTLRDY